MKCEICGKELEPLGFASHIKLTHKISSKDYYDVYIKKPGEGLCLMCGKPTQFCNSRGYKKFCNNECKSKYSQKIKDEKIKNKTKNYSYICELCQLKVISLKALTYHIMNKHKDTTLEQYYTQFMKKPNEGICLECGKPTKYKTLKLGFNKFCCAHCARINEETIKIKRQHNLEKYGQETYVNSEKAKQTKLQKYGSETYNNQEKAKATNLMKYGVENVFQSEEVKEKCKNTLLAKYGVENSGQAEEVKQKIRKTKLQRYGNEYYTNGDKISTSLLSRTDEEKQKSKEKLKQTSLEKYGTEHPTQSDIVKEHIKQTNIEKYGVEAAMQSDIIKDKIRQTNIDKYGIDWNLGRPDIIQLSRNTINSNKLLNSEIEDPDE